MEERDPLKEIFLLRERLHTFFERVPPGAVEGESGAWIPASDIYETAANRDKQVRRPDTLWVRYALQSPE